MIRTQETKDRTLQVFRIAGSTRLGGQAAAPQSGARDDRRDDQRQSHKHVDGRRKEIVRMKPAECPGRRQGSGHDHQLSDQRRRHEDGHANEHAKRSQPEAESPAVQLTDIAADQWRQGGAQVDTHVEDREPAVPLGAPLGIESAHNRRDVRFKEAVSADQQRQARIEGGRVLKHQHRLSGAHQQAAKNHGAPRTQDAVGQQAPEKRRHVHQGRVGAVHGVRFAVAVPEESLRHVEQQQGPHAVIRKPFPHLGEKEGEESDRMTEHQLFLGQSAGFHRCHLSGTPQLVGGTRGQGRIVSC